MGVSARSRGMQILPFGTLPLAQLREAIEFEQRSVRVFGRVHPQPRLTAWYGPKPYAYSGLVWPARDLPPLLAGLRDRVEALTGERFDSVLANLYRGGSDCVGWHADDEPLFGPDPVVASLSFGATRRFLLKRRDGSERLRFELTDGSLLVMPRGTQPHWLHSIPRTKRPVGARVNLTFRHTV